MLWKFRAWLPFHKRPNNQQIPTTLNSYAHTAWEQYTGRKRAKRTAYGVRHIWGHPWNPDAFTAGWNLCYMPFWAGMLTEDQHPHPELQQAVRQASWELYFRDDPVCQPPEFVEDPGLDLATILAGQSLLILARKTSATPALSDKAYMIRSDCGGGVVESVKKIRSEKHQSWSNINKAVRSL